MNYADIKKADIANGLGVRVSLFVSGCKHKCKGCFNPEAWDFNYGKKFDETAENEMPIRHIITLCKFYNVSADYILGFTSTPNQLPKE